MIQAQVSGPPMPAGGARLNMIRHVGGHSRPTVGGFKEYSPLNNNRGNNRRRGRGGNRQNGNGQPTNRIDSRARGNAPQLLEKYRKLAHDAHLNGDRVQEEYYLQFADHYFRVIADTRQRQEEQRVRRDDRWQDSESYRDDAEGAGEAGADSDYGSYDPQQPGRAERAYDEGASNESTDGEGQSGGFDGGENPFVRESRGPRTQRPRRDEPRRDDRSREDRPARDERPAREDRRPRREPVRHAERDEAPAGLDPSMLPPAISAGRPSEEDGVSAVEEAKPRRRVTRKPKPPLDDAGEPLEAVG